MSSNATLRGALRPLLLVLGCLLALPVSASAEVLLTKDEALALAFPGAQIVRGTVFLKEPQVKRVKTLGGSDLSRAIVHPYTAKVNGKVVGTAYFDVHRVRTLSETVMVAIQPDGKIARIEVLSFQEPLEYRPRDKWYAQFESKGLGQEGQYGHGIKKVAGATLTGRATAAAGQRVVALHRVLGEGKPAPIPQPTPKVVGTTLVAPQSNALHARRARPQ